MNNEFPSGKHVVAEFQDDGFRIVTSFLRNIVGPRLSRGRGAIPECPTSGLDFESAQKAFSEWEEFCEKQTKK